jgi:hypothetical protein
MLERKLPRRYQQRYALEEEYICEVEEHDKLVERFRRELDKGAQRLEKLETQLKGMGSTVENLLPFARQRYSMFSEAVSDTAAERVADKPSLIKVYG